MGRKNVLLPHAIVDAASMDADITSKPINTQFLDNIGIQVKWTSSDAVGVVEVQGSNNCKVDGYGDYVSGDFEALTFDPELTQPDSDNGSYLINLNQFPYSFLRIFYDRDSGDGTMSVVVTGKEI